MTLEQACKSVRKVNVPAMETAQNKLNSIIKPLGSLGMLERNLIKIAGIIGSDQFNFTKKAVVVFCADNGVVAQGVTQSGSDVTAIVSENMASGDTCLCAMAQVAGADVIPVDVGIAEDLLVPGLIQRKIAHGTNDFAKSHAMSRRQAVEAIEVGIEMAEKLAADGYALLATGEMGIGNTTTSAAVASALLNLPARFTTGRGAGLSDQGFKKKIAVIDAAISTHYPDREDGVDVLAKVGGFDIAAMAGLCIGGAVFGVPVVLDGFISAVSALVARQICPGVEAFVLASHVSPEPAGQLILDTLNLEAPLQAGMRLGEGTGAVATFPLYDMILSVYKNMVTFQDEKMGAYQPL